MSNPRPILWTPSAERANASSMAAFIRMAEDRLGRKFDDYQDVWRWSVSDLDGFWSLIWDFFDLKSSTPVGTILEKRQLPGAVWFPDVKVNFASQLLRQSKKTPEKTALVVGLKPLGELN